MKSREVNLDLFIPREVLSDFTRARELEWIEANGLGGWASSTVLGLNTRRYHGLLVATEGSIARRSVLISKLEERVSVGGRVVELGCNEYPGVIHPKGHEHLHGFSLSPFPEFLYQIGEVELTKTVLAIYGENSTIVRYELAKGDTPLEMQVSVFLAARDYHSLAKANPHINRFVAFKDELARFTPYEGMSSVYLLAPGSKFTVDGTWYHRVQYHQELARGFEGEEDLFVPGTLSFTLKPGNSFCLSFSTDQHNLTSPWESLAKERQRRESLSMHSVGLDQFGEVLMKAADRFIVRRGPHSHTIIAGYPWFTDWGRDTMISLPGLCIATGRLDEAKSILRVFAQSMQHGLIPNRFPDGSESPEYNSIDATLWFFNAAYQYYLSTHDTKFMDEFIVPRLQESIESFIKGTLYDIKVDDDALLLAGNENTQLTWMDARVHGVPVTPRFGKAVEINALWFSALMIFEELRKEVGGDSRLRGMKLLAGRVKESFLRTFWNNQDQCLLDCVYRNRLGHEVRDSSIRPNQIVALSLPFELLPPFLAGKVLSVVRAELFTPYGLRTLSRKSPLYRGRYEGGSEERDAAYHQGTVWPWLLGAYFTGLLRYGNETDIERDAGAVISALQAHMKESGLLSISEIFDGDEPHLPRGCPFQAWSVAEVLRAYGEYRKWKMRKEMWVGEGEQQQA